MSKEEKVVTKYDLKQQKRAEAKAKAKKESMVEKIIWVVFALALVAFIASFPIRSYMAMNESYVEINGQEISQLEFDYNYNVIKNNYLNTYGSYLAALGMDLSGDLSTTMFSETMTWQDYFEQETVNTLIRGKALAAQAEAAGFTYDTEADYKMYEAGIKEQAKAANLSVKNYIRQAYGSYATMGRVEEFIKESIFTNAYYTQVQSEKAPSDAEVQAYYEADKSAFDSVDYYVATFKADVPIEPTALADPDAEQVEGEDYQPSDAEVEKAMADAKALAEAAEATITTEGELKENVSYIQCSGPTRDWLYDESRKAGDTTIIEHTASNEYYVLSFVDRYLDETTSANVRIITATEDAQAIYDEWKNGEATEESFAALADKYNEGTSFTAKGGLYEDVVTSGTQAEIAAWLFEEGRKAGDAGVVTVASNEASYVLYYAGEGDAEWKMTAQSEILAETMESYLQEISEGYTVEDPKGNLRYLKLEAAAEDATTAE